MEQVFLVVLFLINGQAQFFKDYPPIPMKDMAQCEEQRERADAFFTQKVTPIPEAPPFFVLCSSDATREEDLARALEILRADPKAQ